MSSNIFLYNVGPILPLTPLPLYLLEDFCNRIEQFNDMPIVCGGDWNLIIENIDKKGGPQY